MKYHTLLSLKALRDRNIYVFAVILSGSYHDSNRETLRHFGEVSVYQIGQLKYIDKRSLQSTYAQLFRSDS